MTSGGDRPIRDPSLAAPSCDPTDIEGLDMNSRPDSFRQSQRLLQVGVALLLLTSVEGFGIPVLASPPLGLAAHRLGALLAVLMLAVGLLWPRLDLERGQARIAFWSFLYSGLAILAAYLLAAGLGAGNETLTLTAGAAHGTPLEESTIKVLAFSSAPTGLLAFVLLLRGLRMPAAR
jgi:hydroxylaminobenzene mutase